MSAIFLAPYGDHGSGVRSAPHSLLGYRNSIGKSHLKSAEIPCATTEEMLNNIPLILSNYHKEYVVIGGNHAITLPILQSLQGNKERPFLVMYDAHTDTYPYKSELDCGNWLRFAEEQTLLSGVNLKGVRDKSAYNLSNSMDIPKSGHVHITVDLDVLDPKEYGWASNFNEPNGMSLDKLIDSIYSVRKKTKASITADIVEYDAYKDSSGAGRYACSQILDVLLNVIDS